jgi:hypothetical protein
MKQILAIALFSMAGAGASHAEQGDG